MDSGLLTIMAGEHRTFWSAAATLPQLLPESMVPDVIVGLTRDDLPTAALDLAMHRTQTKALRLGESAVAAARVEPDAQVPGKHRWYPPSPRLDAAAPLCRRTPKQSGIHKEPISKWLA